MDNEDVAESSQDQENLAQEVMDSLGVPDSQEVSEDISEEDKKDIKEDDPYNVKKRLGMQAKRHQKETRELRAELSALKQFVMANQNQPEPSDSYSAPAQGSDEEDKIRRAVRLALNQKEQEEKQAKDAERAAHVHKQYMKLQDKLDNGASKYEDFDEIVRADDAPFTDAIRDAALLIDNPDEVLYRLGKDKAKLKEISALHPVDQAREVIKLSAALMGGNNRAQSSGSKPLSSIRSNPVSNTSMVSDKTPVSELRKRMRANWK